MMSNSGVGYPHDDTLQDEQETGAPALPREPAEPAAEPMPSDQSAIRAAFLARQADPGMTAPGALGEEGADLGGATLRSAYLKRLSEDKTEAVGSTETGDAVLRGVYAARASAPVERSAPRRAAPKKASAGRKKAAKAKAGRPKKAKAPVRKVRAKAAAAAKRARKTGATRKAGTTRKASARKKGRGRAKR